jgi:hypothetical protein
MLKPTLLLLVFLGSSAPHLHAQEPGAIYVTDRFGDHVEGNTFSRPGSIYLVGGPAAGLPCGSHGLADGDYFFELTDLEGTQLLSPDPLADRRVHVLGGVIASYLGTTHLAGGTGPCGATYLRLFPFTVSPMTGEYKIWLTRVADYDPSGAGLFGFLPAKSKSETFELRSSGAAVPQALIRGRVFYDFDQNGLWNPLTQPLEVPIGGWRVELLQDGILQDVTYTDEDGGYTFIAVRDGASRTLREKAPGGFVGDGISGAVWVSTTPRSASVVTSSEQVAGPAFGDVQFELAPGSGRTVEFWSTGGDFAGVPLLLPNDPDWRVALNEHGGLPVALRTPVSNDNPVVSIFTLRLPPQSFSGAFANWKSYVNRTSHDHAGFLLSRQVAAAILNNRFGFMQGSILIDRFHNGVLVPFEDMLAGAIGLLSQVGAGLTGPNDPYQALRASMIACTNEFSSLNNTGDLSAPQVVYTRSVSFASFSVPYN